MSNIKLFESKKIRIKWDEQEAKWYFSVQDVVEVLTDSNDVKQYIKKMLRRDELLKSNWGKICTPVEMKAADGKKRKMQSADTKGLKNQNLRNHMDDLELIFSMLGEASTTAIVKTRNPKGFFENQIVAKQGGDIAGKATKDMETKTGKKVVSSQNYLPESKRNSQLNKAPKK